MNEPAKVIAKSLRRRTSGDTWWLSLGYCGNDAEVIATEALDKIQKTHAVVSHEDIVSVIGKAIRTPTWEEGYKVLQTFLCDMIKGDTSGNTNT